MDLRRQAKAPTAVAGSIRTPSPFDNREVFELAGVRITIDEIIAEIERTAEDEWGIGVVRTIGRSGRARDCFFGHLFRMGELRTLTQLQPGHLPLSADDRRLTEGEVVANRLWEWFEEFWATTFMVYPVNDGANPRYWQGTPRRRVLSMLRALRDGDELRTPESMEASFLASTSGSD